MSHLIMNSVGARYTVRCASVSDFKEYDYDQMGEG